jgi:hypothetical protein
LTALTIRRGRIHRAPGRFDEQQIVRGRLEQAFGETAF